MVKVVIWKCWYCYWARKGSHEVATWFGHWCCISDSWLAEVDMYSFHPKIRFLSFFGFVSCPRGLYTYNIEEAIWYGRRYKGGRLFTNCWEGVICYSCWNAVMSRTNLGLIHITAFIWPSWRFNFNYVLSAVQFQWNLVFLVHYNKLFSQIQLKLSVYFLNSLKWPYNQFLWCTNVPFIVEDSHVKIMGVGPSVVLNAFNLRRGRQVSVSSSTARATYTKKARQ